MHTTIPYIIPASYMHHTYTIHTSYIPYIPSIPYIPYIPSIPYIPYIPSIPYIPYTPYIPDIPYLPYTLYTHYTYTHTDIHTNIHAWSMDYPFIIYVYIYIVIYIYIYTCVCVLFPINCWESGKKMGAGHPTRFRSNRWVTAQVTDSFQVKPLPRMEARELSSLRVNVGKTINVYHPPNVIKTLTMVNLW